MLNYTPLWMAPSGMARAEKSEWEFRYKPLLGEYEVYSGELDDPDQPNKNGANLSIKIVDEAAKEIFNNLGRDVKHACQAAPGEKMRVKNDVVCYLSKEGQYSCYIGFNLQTGKSRPGVIC